MRELELLSMVAFLTTAYCDADTTAGVMPARRTLTEVTRRR